MAKDLTELLIIALILIVIVVIIVACCRGLRRAFEDHITTEDHLARQRQAFFLSHARNARNRPTRPGGVTRAVRITTISQAGDTIALGVYEIQMPRDQNRNGRSQAEALDSAPPPFSTAYEVSTPAVIDIDMDEPPPTYEDYVMYSANNSKVQGS